MLKEIVEMLATPIATFWGLLGSDFSLSGLFQVLVVSFLSFMIILGLVVKFRGGTRSEILSCWRDLLLSMVCAATFFGIVFGLFFMGRAILKAFVGGRSILSTVASN
jgi:hypothetical protein